MGKRQVGELQPTELVVAIMISDLATSPISDSSIPLLYGIVPIITLVLCEILLSHFSMKNNMLRIFSSGRPTYIIKDGKIDQKEMKKARLSLYDLLEELRGLDIYDISIVDTALLETNGEISAIKTDEENRAYVLVVDGVIQDKILSDSPFNKKDLKNFLGKNNLKDIFILSVNEKREVYIALMEK